MFKYIRRAQYHETDQMHIIHHSNYVKWMEEARTAYLDQMGLGYKEVEALGIISPVVSISLDYKKTCQYNDLVEIGVKVKSYNSIVIEFSYEFFNKTNNEICTIAESKHCFLQNGQPISLRRERPDLDKIMLDALSENK